MQEAPSPLTLRPGSVLEDGKYRIVRLIGSGGMGAVYEAENTRMHKRVAIKWMHPMQVAHSGTERLVREAQASARVRHRHAVDIYDVGRDGDTVFLVMEYLEGEPLTKTLARGDIPMHRVIALLLPAMRAVAAAHKEGVVHRDIKPDNIFLARDDDAPEPIPKVLDFGISKLDPRDAGAQAPLTRTGNAIGTPRYMSFEQLSGARDVDGRTDVYAFGVILYESLTGQPPFPAASYPELIYKATTTTPVDVKQLRPEIPTALAGIVMWALARERDQRIQSMEALIEELEPFATEYGFRGEMTDQGLEPLTSLPAPGASASEVRRSEAAPSARALAHPAASGAPAVAVPTAPRVQSRVRGLIAPGIGLLVLCGGGVLLLGSRAPTSALPSARSASLVSPTRELPALPAPARPVQLADAAAPREPPAQDARITATTPTAQPVKRAPRRFGKSSIRAAVEPTDTSTPAAPPASELAAGGGEPAPARESLIAPAPDAVGDAGTIVRRRLTPPSTDQF